MIQDIWVVSASAANLEAAFWGPFPRGSVLVAVTLVMRDRTVGGASSRCSVQVATFRERPKLPFTAATNLNDWTTAIYKRPMMTNIGGFQGILLAADEWVRLPCRLELGLAEFVGVSLLPGALDSWDAVACVEVDTPGPGEAPRAGALPGQRGHKPVEPPRWSGKAPTIGRRP